MSRKTVFITGGASGLGQATALQYARLGYKVCIGDVHEARGRETEGQLQAIEPGCFYRPCDVSRLKDLEAVRDELEAVWGGVEIVINNAGVGGVAGYIEEATLADWEWVLDINVLGVVRGCKAFLPVLKKQGYGHIVNVASMAGLMNAPMMANYNVSKAGVISLSETLRTELADFGIGVSVVCPAFFQTNLTENMRTTVPGMHSKVHKLMKRSGIRATDVADAIIAAVNKGEFYVLTHPPERRLWHLKRLWPEGFAWLLQKKTRGFLPGQRN